MPLDLESRFYKKADLARLLAVSTRTIERMDDLRKLPGRVVLPTGSVRWFRHEIERWLDSLAKESA